MLDAPEVTPTIRELIERLRLTSPTDDEVRAHLLPCPAHGFALLAGLRRHREWTALGDHCVGASIDALRRACTLLIADIDADLEGESETGSFDIADRNALSRHLASNADVVVVTGRADLVGVSRLVRIVDDVIALGVDIHRIRPVIMRSGRSVLAARDIRHCIERLLAELRPSLRLDPPEMVELPKGVEGIILDGLTLPRTLTDALVSIVAPVLGSGRSTHIDPLTAAAEDPNLITPGSLGIAS
jgi:hypothetical protein